MGKLITWSRIYLNVSFEDKDIAQKMGARWDSTIKSWYVPIGAECEALVNRFGRLEYQENFDRDPIEEFKLALTAAGLSNDTIIADGKIHRIPTLDDKKGKKSGVYALFLDQKIPGGYIQNYKTGEKVNWKAEGKYNNLTPEQKTALIAEINKARELRAKEAHEINEKTANIATLLWSEANPVETNEYCTRKQIYNVNALKIVPENISQDLYDLGVRIVADSIELKAAREKSDNELFHYFIKDSLLIAAKNHDGEIKTLQQINDMKIFMKGGEKSGNYCTTNGMNIDSEIIIITEGFATADAVNQITSKQVVACFDVGNMENVAVNLRELYPNARIIIAADNDHIQKSLNGVSVSNIGIETAKKVALKINAEVVIPPFSELDLGTDWNDFLIDKGLEEAKNLFYSQISF